MKSKLLAILIGFLHFSVIAQCDVSIIDYDYTTGDLTIDIINSENCGCNEFTNIDNTCDESGSPIVQNNETISSFVIGLHVPGLEEDYVECVDNTYHDGWTWKVKNFASNTDFDSGDTWNVNVYEFSTSANDCWDDILNYAQDNGVCAELVVWQINLSQTPMISDGGWAFYPNTGNQTQSYPDVDITNNSFLICPPPPPPDAPDAVIDGVVIETGCIGDMPVYNISYIVYNYGQDTITDYCVEIWNEDYYMCFDEDLFGPYAIPPGEGQLFQTPFWEGEGNEGSFFVMSVDNVNDEIITANNNTTIFFPEFPECPIECEGDTIIEYITDTLYIEIIDTLYINTIDTLYITLPPDTITEYITLPPDTITEYITLIDTLYITLPPDTLIIIETEYITEYIHDTTYVDVIIDNYIYITDTITEYTTEYIDCITGLPCGENPGMGECYPWTVYIPNTFTPNNDGINDVWKIIYDLDCWIDVEFWVFNRWGNEVYHNYGDLYDSHPYWDGSVNDGEYYVPDGVYYYIVNAKKHDNPVIIKKTGSVTIFR